MDTKGSLFDNLVYFSGGGGTLLPRNGTIGHNSGMGYRWVLATILICPMSAGCLRDGGKASPPAVESPSKLPSGKTAEANVSIYYHLPLIIELDAPAVPPEIERPSPPIPDRVKTF